MKEGSKKVKENNIEEKKNPHIQMITTDATVSKKEKIRKKSDGKKRYKKPLKITKKLQNKSKN